MPSTSSMLAAASAAFMVAILSPAMAQTAPAQPAAQADDSFFGLGIGLSSERSPYKGVGYENHVIPVVSYESRQFSIQGKTADLHLLGDETLSFSARAEYGFGDGYKGSDSSALIRTMAWAQVSARMSKNSSSAASSLRSPGNDSPIAPIRGPVDFIGKAMTVRSPRASDSTWP